MLEKKRLVLSDINRMFYRLNIDLIMMLLFELNPTKHKGRELYLTVMIPAIKVIWVIPPDVTRSIRRPRLNSLKLSVFVENFSLIILIIIFFKINSVFVKIKAKYEKCAFFKKKKWNLRFYRKSGESPTFFTWISKLITYSDSSWKTASESVGTRRHLTNFIGSTRPLSNALEKHTLRKNQPQSWNEPEWWH